MEKYDVPVVEVFNGSHKKSLIPQPPNPVKGTMELVELVVWLSEVVDIEIIN